MQAGTHTQTVAVATTSSSRRILVGVLGSVLFAVLTWAGANITIPLHPVPITLQTLFVLLSGAILGSRYGALSQMMYVGAGVAGAPVFAAGAAGTAIVTGVTSGYLLGFVLAPMLVGHFIDRRCSAGWYAVIFWCGSLTILGLGVTVITLFFAGSFGEALQVGYVPFVIGDLIKIAAAVSIYKSYRAIRDHRVHRSH